MEFQTVRWAVLAVVCQVLTAMGGEKAAAQNTPAAYPVVFAAKPRQASCTVSRTQPSDAEASLAREDYAKATDLFTAMAAKAPDASRSGIIRTRLAQDRVRDADELVKAWIAEEPASIPAMEMHAEVLLRQGDLRASQLADHAVFALDLCNARALLNEAAIDELSANWHFAKMHIELAHQLAPLDPDIRHAWIGTLPRKRRLEERALLLKDENLLSAREKSGLEESLAHAAEYHPSDCSVVDASQQGKVPIMQIFDGPSRATGEAGVDVTFNGRKRRMQLDTGASGLVLSKAGAAGLGLVREAKFTSGGIGDKGDVSTSSAHVSSVKIGNLEFRNCEVEILEKGSALDNNGLIGADIFRKFLVTLDFPKLEMRLDALPPRPGDKKAPVEKLKTEDKPTEQPIESAEDEQEDWKDRYIAPEMKDWVPIFRSGHQLLLPVRIGDAKEKLFIVDTGASLMLISPDAAREVTKVKNNSDERIYGISGEVNKVYQTGKFQITFGNLGQKVDNMTSIDTTRISHSTGVEVSGFMGAPVLFRLTIHIDYRDNLMKLDYDRKN